MVGFSISLSFFFFYVWYTVVMGTKEPNLMLKTVASFMIVENVWQPEETFGFVA